jgi:hypothetical protein
MSLLTIIRERSDPGCGATIRGRMQRSWQLFEMPSSKMVRGEGAAMLCAVLPIVGGRDTATAARWLSSESTTVTIGHDIPSTYQRSSQAEPVSFCKRHVAKREPQTSQSWFSLLDLGRRCKGVGEDFGAEAMLQLRRIAIFCTGFLLD